MPTPIERRQIAVVDRDGEHIYGFGKRNVDRANNES